MNQLNPSGALALRFTNLLSRLLNQVRPGSRPHTMTCIDDEIACGNQEKCVTAISTYPGLIKLTINNEWIELPAGTRASTNLGYGTQPCENHPGGSHRRATPEGAVHRRQTQRVPRGPRWRPPRPKTFRILTLV